MGYISLQGREADGAARETHVAVLGNLSVLAEEPVNTALNPGRPAHGAFARDLLVSHR